MKANSDSIRLHLGKSLIVAPVATLITYACLFVFQGTYVHTLFYERGAMPFLCTWCTFIALALLFFRRLELNKDFSSLYSLEDKLTSVGKLEKSSVDELIGQLKKDKSFVSGSLVVSRFQRVMRHVKSGTSWSDTESLVRGTGQIDREMVESSYTHVKFMIWLIPVLGFIGTVLGIGEAIGGFNAILTSSKDFDAMKGALGNITNSLAYAFDTTLVALVQDAIVMFILSIIQKQGDDFISDLDQVFTDDVLHRIEKKSNTTDGLVGGFNENSLAVLEKFSESNKELSNLEKLHSFEGTLHNIQELIQTLKPTLENLQKKRSLTLKLQEIEED